MSLDSRRSGGYPRAVTDADEPRPDPGDGTGPVALDESASQEMCPCCGLEMPADLLAGLVTQLLPVVTPGTAPEMAAD
jgi:hypothetical protein